MIGRKTLGGQRKRRGKLALFLQPLTVLNTGTRIVRKVSRPRNQERQLRSKMKCCRRLTLLVQSGLTQKVVRLAHL